VIVAARLLPRPALAGRGWGEGLSQQILEQTYALRVPLTRRVKSAATSPRKRGEVRKFYTRVHSNRRRSACAAPNGVGINGPGGARVISATNPSAIIASQNVSQNPSI
jgi:hypothetical protein